MNLRFYIDPETGLPHIYRHSVEKNEVEDVLNDPGEVRRGSDDSRIAHGQTGAGRYLKVIYAHSTQSDDTLFIITARELRGKPLAAYRRYLRRRGR